MILIYLEIYIFLKLKLYENSQNNYLLFWDGEIINIDPKTTTNINKVYDELINSNLDGKFKLQECLVIEKYTNIYTTRAWKISRRVCYRT